MEDIHDKSMTHINESKKQSKDVDFLKNNLEKNGAILKEKEANIQ
jgi:hypothetical protein